MLIFVFFPKPIGGNADFVSPKQIQIRELSLRILISKYKIILVQMVKNLQCRRPGFNPWIRKIPWRRE